MLKGRVNTDKMYVCDNGDFRLAQPIETNSGKVCTIDNRDEYYVFDKDENGNKQYSFYKCMEDGWMIAHDKFNTGEITDSRNGKKYKTVGIKTQIWMAENMDIDYKIKPLDSDSVIYGSYTNSECDTCGHYYTWAAAMDSAGVFSTNALGCGYGKTCSMEYPVRGICPEGWHLPSMDEWETLVDAVGGGGVAGDMLKSQFDWEMDGNGLDAYGFSALPAGYHHHGNDEFIGLGGSALFWSSTEENFSEILAKRDAGGIQLCAAVDPSQELVSGFNPVYLNNEFKTSATSVRCLKDPD